MKCSICGKTMVSTADDYEKCICNQCKNTICPKCGMVSFTTGSFCMNCQVTENNKKLMEDAATLMKDNSIQLFVYEVTPGRYAAFYEPVKYFPLCNALRYKIKVVPTTDELSEISKSELKVGDVIMVISPNNRYKILEVEITVKDELIEALSGLTRTLIRLKNSGVYLLESDLNRLVKAQTILSKHSNIPQNQIPKQQEDNAMNLEDLENHIQTIYEAKENGGIINPKEEAMRILDMCNRIKKRIIDEFEAKQKEEQ